MQKCKEVLAQSLELLDADSFGDLYVLWLLVETDDS